MMIQKMVIILKETKLTPKQERFIQNIVAGMSQRQAYKEAFQIDYDDNAIDSNASTLFNSTKVKQRYQELIEELQDKTIMSAKERMMWLTEVINGNIKDTVYYNVNGENTPIEKTADISTKIKAVDTLNKMSGEYVTNIKGNIGVTYEETLKKVSDPDEY